MFSVYLRFSSSSVVNAASCRLHLQQEYGRVLRLSPYLKEREEAVLASCGLQTCCLAHQEIR